jgi:DNA-binding transcriptional ArsR family regulator
MSSTAPFNEELWFAIAEPSRRKLIEVLLLKGEATASRLADEVPFSRQAVSKHLAVLKRAGLVKRSVLASRQKDSVLQPRNYHRLQCSGMNGSKRSNTLLKRFIKKEACKCHTNGNTRMKWVAFTTRLLVGKLSGRACPKKH